MLWSCLLEVLHLYLVGVTVLPDLAVDIVLAQTSSDEEDITEPKLCAGTCHFITCEFLVFCDVYV